LHVVKALAAGFEGQTGKSICLEGGGSRAGVKAAIAGQVHLTFLSRALSEQEKEAGLVGFPSAFEENRREALAVGADDFLGKPFREAELFGKIEALLGVRYRYAEPASAEGASSGQSQFGRLPAKFTDHLPASLVNESREATLGVDVERMLELIEGVANHDAQLGEELRRLVHQFEYKRVLQLQYLTRHGN
jgi:DNA-binding response OmpR family regulator